MKKRVVGLLLAVSLMITACGTSVTDNDETINSSEYLGQGTVGDQWYASAIYGVVTKDLEVDLKDDYFTAVNKDYLAGLTIEDGYPSAGVLKEADDIIKERTLTLLLDENPASHDAELVSSLYELTLDWDSRNKLGIEPIKPSVEKIKSLSSIEDITEYLLDTEDVFQPGLSGAILENSMADPGNYTVSISSTALFLGDAAEYTKQSEYGEIVEGVNESIFRYMMGRLDFSEEDITRTWEECKVFETAIARHMLTLEDAYASDIYDRITNVYTLEELRDVQGNYPLTEVLQAQGWGGSDTYNLQEPDWLTALSELYTEENVDIIKSYLLAHYVSSVDGKIDRDAYETVTEYTNVLNGVTGIIPDEELGMAAVDTYLPDCMDYVYIDKYCTEEERQQVIDMIHDFQSYYKKMLEQENWISEETKQYAIEKVENMTIRACYSDTREDFSELTFASKEEGGTYFEALQVILKKQLSMLQEHINQAVDTSEMEMSTREVNAYYDMVDNSVNIMCGILVGAYSMDQSYEVVLATVGATTIGHEMSHAFDTGGAQFDKDGNHVNWWQEEDYKAFEERADKLVEYMNQITPYEGSQPVNGDMQKGEMIADLGGVKVAMMIAADQEDFDYDEFFRGLAKAYAQVCTKNLIISNMQTDPHPMDNLRINICAEHCDEFLETYDIRSGDGMYLAPEDRVWVW